MKARERILALRLLEKQKRNPELAKQLGIKIRIVKNQIQNNFNERKM